MAAGRVAATNRAAYSRIDSIADLPGLKWWVEPDGIVATDAVDSWTDKSGNGNTITETGSNRPTLVTNALDGYNGVRVVSASSQRLKKTNSPLFSTGAVSFGLVMRVDAVVALSRYLCNAIASTNGLEFCDASGTFSPTYAGVDDQVGNSIAPTVGTFHIFTFRVPGPKTNGSYRYNRANAAIVSTTGLINPGATSSLILGARDTLTLHSSATFIAGFLCNRYLTTTQIQAAENYWKAKYPTLT